MTYLVPSKTRREVTNLWDGLFDLPNYFESKSTFDPIKPLAVDVDTNSDEVTVKVEIPGVNKDDINVEYQDNTLTVSVERKEEENDSDGSQSYREIRKGRFSRSITVGEVDFENSTGNYEKGILAIALKRVEESKPKQLKIK